MTEILQITITVPSTLQFYFFSLGASRVNSAVNSTLIRLLPHLLFIPAPADHGEKMLPLIPADDGAVLRVQVLGVRLLSKIAIISRLRRSDRGDVSQGQIYLCSLRAISNPQSSLEIPIIFFRQADIQDQTETPYILAAEVECGLVMVSTSNRSDGSADMKKE